MKFVAGKPSQEVFWLSGVAGVRSYEAQRPVEPSTESLGFPKGGCYSMRRLVRHGQHDGDRLR